MKHIGIINEKPINEMELTFSAKSSNESFARVAASAFASQLDPTLEELSDIRTAVSEAVTNAIIHGYEGRGNIGNVHMNCRLYNNMIEIVVSDKGKGIEDIELAMQPLYTSKPELERSGMGFSVMESFMDGLEVTSIVPGGTTVRMIKYISAGKR